MHPFYNNSLIFNLLMSSTCFELGGSSSGRQLYSQVWYSVFYIPYSSTYKTTYIDACKTYHYHNCTYNRLTADKSYVIRSEQPIRWAYSHVTDTWPDLRDLAEFSTTQK